MLSWSSIAALKCAFRHALVALQKKFYPLTPAQFADGAGITCHLIESSSRAQVKLHSTPFRRSATIVRNRRNIRDRCNIQTGGLQRADRGLATRTWPLDKYFDLS